MPENTITSPPKASYLFDDIRAKIYVIRGVQVMLDYDLAAIYGYETKSLNRQVKNYIEKFYDEDFMFQLTKDEAENLSRCKKYTLNKKAKRGSNVKYLPYAFTEQGIYMLMTVLRGTLATQQSKTLVRVFKTMRDYLSDNAIVFQRLDRIELKQLEADEKFSQIFKQLEAPRQNKAIIFFKGQMWDATNCIEEIISNAQKSIILIDGYVDRNTLSMLTGKKACVSVTICTSKKNCKITEQESKAFNHQYGPLNIKFTDEFHDRFLIVDEKFLYHIGASIKDAGRKAFEISICEDEKLLSAILSRL